MRDRIESLVLCSAVPGCALLQQILSDSRDQLSVAFRRRSLIGEELGLPDQR